MTSCVIENDIAIISLQEGKANAVSHNLIDDVSRGLDLAEKDAKAVLIRGSAGMFSAGFDLKEFKKGPEATQALVKRGTEILLRIFMHPQPVIAECTGHAVAAGAFILLAADTRFGADGDFKSVVNSLDDARSHLRRMKAVGAISVKSYNQPRRDQRQQVLQAARELGMMVVPEGGSTFFTNVNQVIDGHTSSVF